MFLAVKLMPDVNITAIFRVIDMILKYDNVSYFYLIRGTFTDRAVLSEIIFAVLLALSTFKGNEEPLRWTKRAIYLLHKMMCTKFTGVVTQLLRKSYLTLNILLYRIILPLSHGQGRNPHATLDVLLFKNP